eukprot:gene22913-24223_t
MSNAAAPPKHHVPGQLVIIVYGVDYQVAFATGVLPNIYEFHLYTRNSTRLSKILPGLILPVLSLSSRVKELYDPKAFITHAALLDQAFAHCPIFPTAASRRSLGRVSVPVWLIILSDQLRIVALQSFLTVIPNPRADSHALRTRAPLDPKVSFDLHVLGMPPAFNPGQSPGNPNKTKLREPMPAFVKRNGYEGHTNNGLFYTASRSPKTPGRRRRRPHVPSSINNVKEPQTTDGGQPSSPDFLFRGGDCPSMFATNSAET